MPNNEEIIGARVRNARGSMRQTEVADVMKAAGYKWHQATVWGVETGDRPLRLSEAAILSRLFDVSIEEFATGVDVTDLALREYEQAKADFAVASDRLIEAEGKYRAHK